MAPMETLVKRVPAPVTRRAAVGAAGVGIVSLGLGVRPASASASAQATPTALPPVVERWAAAWTAHDAEALAALFTADGLYEDLAFGASYQGPDGVAEWMMRTLAFLPDASIELVAAFQAGDRATAEWIFTGTRLAPGGPQEEGDPGTFAVRAASVFELEGDLIRRVSDYYNPTDLSSQPAPANDADTAGEAATPPV